MIEPKSTDVGRKIVHTQGEAVVHGVIRGFNEHLVRIVLDGNTLEVPVRREFLDGVTKTRLDLLRGAGATVTGPDARGAYLVNERWYAYPASGAGPSRHLDNSPAFSSWRQLLEAVKAPETVRNIA